MDESNHGQARPGNSLRVFVYFASLLLIANLVTPSGSLAQIPISFYLKDHLNLSAKQLAMFGLLSSVPLYGAFLFGMLRDRWSPFGLGDRGFFIVFAPVAAIAYVSLAFRHDSYPQLLFGLVAVGLAYRLIGPGVAGLTATVSRKLQMTGRLGSLVQFVGTVIGAVLAYATGWIQLHLGNEEIFLVLFAASLGLLLIGLLKPRAVFQEIAHSPRPKVNLLSDIGRLLSHKALWPALLISLTWSFGPGQNTPLFYHLTNVIHMKSDQFGLYAMIGALAFIPGLVAYGFLCRRVAPRTLLIVATLIAIPQMIPLNYIDSVTEAYIASVVVGLTGGMAAVAYYDLLLRSCPKGLEGSTLELSITGGVLVERFGNLLGSKLYDRPGGFYLCNWITVGAYALILPMILLVPKDVLAHRDGES